MYYTFWSLSLHWPLCFNAVAVWGAAIFSTTLHVDIYWSYKQDFGCRPVPGHRHENHILNDFTTLLKAIFTVIIWTWLRLCSDFPLLVMPYKSNQVNFHAISQHKLPPPSTIQCTVLLNCHHYCHLVAATFLHFSCLVFYFFFHISDWLLLLLLYPYINILEIYC